MKKYLFFASLAVLFLGFAFGIIYAMRTSKSTFVPNFELPQASISEGDEPQSEPAPKTWQHRFSQSEPKDYSPAAERFAMRFEVDTSMFRPKSKYYQLSIDKNSIYSMFALKQILNSYKVKYSLTRTSEALDIFLETDKQALLEDIVKNLKQYDINAKFKEVWL